MPPATSRNGKVDESKQETINSIWAAIRAHLESKIDRVQGEIRNYPSPIPACDQHYNHLLEERGRISRELGRMHDASKECLTAKDAVALIEDFIDSSDFIDAEADQRITSSCQDELRKLKA